jgi:hypothetical protein
MAINITASIYPGTGASLTAKDSGQTTRHYASDGSSPTHDWECTGVSWQNYEATCMQNIPGDELSIKCWGPGHRIGILNRYQYGLMEPAAGIFSK